MTDLTALTARYITDGGDPADLTDTQIAAAVAAAVAAVRG